MRTSKGEAMKFLADFFSKFPWKATSAGKSQTEPFDVHHLLDLGLAQAGISLQFKPVCRMTDGRVFGVEACVCWRQPDGHSLHFSPTEFDELASKNDLFLPLGNWVLENACQQVARWQRAFGPLVFACTLSQRQLHDAADEVFGPQAYFAPAMDPDALTVLLKKQAASRQCARRGLRLVRPYASPVTMA